jgi:hypothetical protein
MIIGDSHFKKLNEEAIIDVSSQPVEYGQDYFEEFERRSNSPIAKRLYQFRQSYAESLGNEGPILDYGSGYGVIVLSDVNNRWYGTDINPYCKKHLGSKYVDPSAIGDFETVCFFDVLEHFQDPIAILGLPQGKVVVTIPLKSTLKDLSNWKHWKPKEHFLYATPKGFEELVVSCNYRILDHNMVESSIGRQDIHTYCLEKHD